MLPPACKRILFAGTLSACALWAFVLSPVAIAQNPADQPDPPSQPESRPIQIPKIPDEPKTVDPARFVPKALAASVTVRFDESSLREVAQWIRDEQKIPVLFDMPALSAEGILPGQPVSDSLDNEPLYLMLNRLRSLGVDWYVEQDILHLTTIDAAEARMVTRPYNLGGLLDAGYQRDDLGSTLLNTTSGPWMDVDGEGGKLEWLGDVLFVRHNDRMQREVQGLLAALRKHGRQTFTLDPPQHQTLRQKLVMMVSADFDDTPLSVAVEQLAEQAKAKIRLDHRSLRAEGVHERQPVTLELSDRELGTVLTVMLAPLHLTWTLRDGLIWVTTTEQAQEQMKTAVYDVRDLCRDRQEAEALREAIYSQTEGPWFEIDGEGGMIEFARAGTMVVRQTERRLNETGQLLETYRQALRASKPRDRAEERGREVITLYYRMHDRVAEDLMRLLPKLVEPDSWKSDATPEAPGTILKVASQPGLLDAEGQLIQVSVDDGEVETSGDAVVLPQAVLIIRQRRSIHETIAETIQRVEEGDPFIDEETGYGLGGMGGGFGGGFFSIP